jgi:hypothetical protein
MIDQQPQDRSVDLDALMQERGYMIAARNRQNAIFRLQLSP